MMARPFQFRLAALMLGVFACACGGRQTDDAPPWPAGGDSYLFEEPDAVFDLPDELAEISGLAAMGDSLLAAVQDEDGILYVIDPTSGTIVDERSFGGPGDYEAVEIAAGRLFILESDGTLHRFDAWTGGQLEGDEIELDLPNRCDAEGLRHDEEGRRLLVSCKDEPGPDLEIKKAVYAFDLDGRRLAAEPAYTLDSRIFSISVEDHPVNEAVRSVLSERVDLSGFRPSDLAIHPVTDELFVISSVREAVVAIRRDGTVTGVWGLSDDLVEQPEGLDFFPNGDLFLASEAGDRKNGVLLRFNYRGSQPEASE